MADDTLSINEFAAKIRERRPDLANIPDSVLVGKTLAGAPELKQFVRMEYNDKRGADFQSPRFTGTTGDSVIQGMENARSGMWGLIKGMGKDLMDAANPATAPMAAINKIRGLPAAGSPLVTLAKQGAEAGVGSLPDSIQPVARGFAQQQMPGLLTDVPGPDDPRTAEMQQAAGANLLGTTAVAAAPYVASGVSKVASPVFERLRGVAPTPESLKIRAMANRELGGNIVDDASHAHNSATGIVRLGRNVYSRAAAPIQEYLAEKLDPKIPIGNAVIDDSVAQIAGPMETRATRLPSTADQYRPQFSEGALPVADKPLNIPRPKPGEIPEYSTPAVAPATSADLNKWMNVKESQLMYGKNPGEQIMKEGLLGADKASTLQNVTASRKAVGSAMEEAFKRAETSGVKFNIESDIQSAIADAKKTIGKSSDESFMKAIEGIENDIVSRTDDLKSMTPSAAHELEVELGRGVKWTGASSDVQRLLKDIRSRISKQLKTVEGIPELKDRWGNLFEGENALKSSLRKDAMGRGTGSVFDQLRKK